MTVRRRLALTLLALASAAAAASQARAPRMAAPAPATMVPAAAPAPSPVTDPAPPLPEIAAKEAAGQLAAQAWLTLLDRRDWGTAWETSAAMFRNTVPLGNWIEGIPKSRQPLGALQDRRVQAAVHKSQLQGRPDGDYVTVIFASRFEHREIEEALTTVHEADGRWRVTGYSTR